MDQNDIILDCNNRSPTRYKGVTPRGPFPCSSEKYSELYQPHTARYHFDMTAQGLDKLGHQHSRCNTLEPFVSNLRGSNCLCPFHSLYFKFQ